MYDIDMAFSPLKSLVSSMSKIIRYTIVVQVLVVHIFFMRS